MPLEYRANWTSGITGPGVTVVHGRDTAVGSLDAAAQELADRLQAFFTALAGVLPAAVGISFDAEAVMLNTTTGVLESVHPVDPPDPVTGNVSVDAYARPAGARVDWLTAAVVSGRRLRGRTFLVPTGFNTYDNTGTLTSSAITTLNTAAAAYYDEPFGLEAVAPSVWSRTHGIAADITGHEVPDEVAVLSSRRD